MFFIKRRKYKIGFLLFFLVCSIVGYRLVSSHINKVRAQSSQGEIPYAGESSSISPTPSIDPSSTSTVPDINPESLRDPDAFKLDQQIKQATRELLKSTDTSTGENKASYRKTLMRQAIKKYPYVFLGNVLTSSQTSSLDEKLLQYVEKPLTLSNAELGVMHIDDFENYKNSSFEYSLQNLKDHTRFNFYPASSSHMQDGEGAFGGHISGTTLNVNGVALDDDVTARVLGAPQVGGENNDPVVTNVEVLKEASPDALGGQKTAIIFVYPKGTDITQLPPKEEIFNNILTGDVQKFFKEASYGKMWLDEANSHMYGWYEIGSGIGPCSLFDHLNEVISIVDANIDLTRYDRLMFAVNGFHGGCAILGKLSLEDQQTGPFRSSVGTFGTFIESGGRKVDYFFWDFAFVHEMGHNLGVAHANAWRCKQGSLEGNCEHIEGGNTYDVMGGGRLNHFNGYFKHVFQWLNKPVINITSSGRYRLQPLENSDAVIAKIYRPELNNFPIYYLEARIPVGFDNNPATSTKIKGIHINWVYEPLRTRLILGPEREDGLWDQPSMRIGKSFHDYPVGLTITNIDNNIIDVRFEEPAVCKRNNFGFEMLPVLASSSLTGEATIENLTCSDIKCTLKRKKDDTVFIAFRFKVINNNSYSCPGVNVEGFLFQHFPENGTTYSRVKLIESGREAFYAPSKLFVSTTPSGIYKFQITVQNREDSSIIVSMPREVELVDDFQILEGDLNNDEKVDIFDLVTVAKDFGKKGEGFPGDADKNGVVDIFDLVIVAKNFGKKL